MIDWLLDALGGWGLGGICLLAAVLAFGETAIFMDLVVPGEVGMVIAGAAAAEAGEPALPVVAAAALGAVLGDSLSYAVGRRWGRGVIDRFSFTRRRLAPFVDRAERHFEDHGGRTVFLGRWVGALRAVVPFVAGLGHLRFGSFLLWNVAASLSWAGVVVTLGHVVGRSIADVVDRVGGGISLVVVAGLVGWWLVRRRRRDRDRSGRSRSRSRST